MGAKTRTQIKGTKSGGRRLCLFLKVKHFVWAPVISLLRHLSISLRCELHGGLVENQTLPTQPAFSSPTSPRAFHQPGARRAAPPQLAQHHLEALRVFFTLNTNPAPQNPLYLAGC